MPPLPNRPLFVRSVNVSLVLFVDIEFAVQLRSRSASEPPRYLSVVVLRLALLEPRLHFLEEVPHQSGVKEPHCLALLCPQAEALGEQNGRRAPALEDLEF